MRRFLLLSVSVLIFITGCLTQPQELTFTNMSYETGYNKTLEFAKSKGWKIAAENKKEGTIEITLREFTPINPAKSSNPYARPEQKKDVLAIKITPITDNQISVKVSGRKGDLLGYSAVWDPAKTIEEYKAFMSQAAVEPIPTINPESSGTAEAR